MPEQVLTGIKNLPQHTTKPVIIGCGAHGTIELDPTSMIVCKRFQTLDTTEAAALAQREFEHLQRFSAVLAAQPFLHCPDPVSVEPDRGTVWMTYCAGLPLNGLLAASSDSITEHLDHIAEQIVIALECYIGEFDAPYYDLVTNNMLYQMSTRTLCLIDFTIPAFLRRFEPHQAPFEISLGTFIGVTTCHTVGRVSSRNHAYWKCQERLSLAVLDRLSSNHDLCPSLIRQVSAAAYNSMDKSNKRRPLRQLWYATVGQMLFNRRTNTIIAKSLPGFRRAR
jgi:hypothetical protein